MIFSISILNKIYYNLIASKMFYSSLVNSNENILRVIFSYADVKDLAALSSVNRIYNKVTTLFNNNWREACNNYFCSFYESYR
jgi:hypothetical protein